MKLTKFGKIIRKFRIDYNILLGDMAKSLKISPSYLSSIEVGEREIPQDFFEKIKSLNIFNDNELEEIQKSIDQTMKTFIIKPKDDIRRNMVAGFARSFDNLTNEQIEAIQEIINNNKKEGNE